MTDANEADQQKKTEMEEAELQGRLGEFNKELTVLLQKYEIALGASPFITPDGRVGARPLALDARKLPKPQQPAPKDAVAEGGVTEA